MAKEGKTLLKKPAPKFAERLHKDGEDRQYEREKLVKQKERYDQDEALILANTNHGLNKTDKIRSIDEFIDD